MLVHLHLQTARGYQGWCGSMAPSQHVLPPADEVGYDWLHPLPLLFPLQEWKPLLLFAQTVSTQTGTFQMTFVAPDPTLSCAGVPWDHVPLGMRL